MASTYEPRATYTASNSASFTFSSIPSTYTDLLIVSTLNRTTANSGASQLRMQFNSDTGSNYSYTRVYGNGSTAASDRGSSQTYINPFSAGDPNTGVVNTINIMNYANTTTNKTVLGRASNGDANGFAYANVTLWRSTSAITSIYLFSTENFASGTVTLYGIKAA